jgi:hypothetical protein
MTDRIAGFTVALKDDVRVDDVEPLRAAIEQFAGVLSVTPVVSDPSLHIAHARADIHWRVALIDFIKQMP